jgi:hypothetical protein
VRVGTFWDYYKSGDYSAARTLTHATVGAVTGGVGGALATSTKTAVQLGTRASVAYGSAVLAESAVQTAGDAAISAQEGRYDEFSWGRSFGVNTALNAASGGAGFAFKRYFTSAGRRTAQLTKNMGKGAAGEAAAKRMYADLGEGIIETHYGNNHGFDFASYTGKGAEARLFLNEVKSGSSRLRPSGFTTFGLGKSGEKTFRAAMLHAREAIEGAGLDQATTEALVDQLLNRQARVRLIGGAGTVFDPRITQRIGETTGFVTGEGFRLPGVR